MTTFSTKNIIKIIITILGISVVIFLVFNKTDNIGGNQTTNEILSPREQSINDYLAGKKNFKEVSFGNRSFSLVVYRDSEGTWNREKTKKIYNHPDQIFLDENGRAIKHRGFIVDRGGIILFEGSKIFWESEEPFAKIFPETVSVADIDNDGTNEIYVVDLGGEKLTGCAVYVYKFKDDRMILVSPYQEDTVENNYKYKRTKLTECDWSFSSNWLVDFDNDNVFEIVTREYTPENSIIVYKWTGEKYSPWRKLSLAPEIGLGEYKGLKSDFVRDSKLIQSKQ